MSKSRKNTIDPESMINNYGADAVRLFILSDSPPEKDVQWSEQGMSAAYKFIQKFWLLHKKIMEKINSPSEKSNLSSNEELGKYTNNLINKINKQLERFSYNVIVANMHETYNFLFKLLENDTSNKQIKENYKKILTVFSPVIPHFIFECLEDLKSDTFQKWPEVNKKLLEVEEVQFVIQINGKKRATLSTVKDIDQKTLMEELKKNDKINKNFIDKKIMKIFFVKNRLINILLK